MPRPVGQQMARATSLFQALVALPAMIVLAGWAMMALFETNIPIYDFIASTFNSLFAAGIIFIVFVQHNTNMSPSLTLSFELAKSGLATAMWLWLILDCAVGPDHWNGYQRYPRGPRIVRAAISVIVPLILYYPTLVYAKYKDTSSGDGDTVAGPEASAGQGAERGEREPLLG